MKLKYFAAVIGLSFFIISGSCVYAGDPLTDYRLGQFALNLNLIYGAERAGFSLDQDNQQIIQFASKTGTALEYVGTVGIGHNFALEYRNWGINSTLDAPGGYSGTVNTNLMNQEVLLLYRVGPRLWYDFVSDVGSIFSGKPTEHEEVAHTRDLFALVVGWDNIRASQSGNVTSNLVPGSPIARMITPPNSNRSSVVIGYEMSYQVFPKLFNSIRATYSFNNAFYGEMGYSYEIMKNTMLVGQIATKDIFNNGGIQADNFYMNGVMVGLTYQY